MFIIDEEKTSAQWLEQMKTTLSCQYPGISANTLRWSELHCLKDSDVRLLCAPIDSQQRGLLNNIHCAIICTQINKTIHQMLIDGHVSAVICDDWYQQGYQSIHAVISSLIHNILENEDSVLIPPQLILRASLPSLYLPPPSYDTTAKEKSWCTTLVYRSSHSLCLY